MRAPPGGRMTGYPARGSSIQTFRPGVVFSAQSLPWWRPMAREAMARPRPTPPVAVWRESSTRKKGWKILGRASAGGGGGEAGPAAAGGGVARIVDAEEGLEDFGEGFGGHAGAVIAHADARHAAGVVERGIDAGAGGRIKDGGWPH